MREDLESQIKRRRTIRLLVLVLLSAVLLNAIYFAAIGFATGSLALGSALPDDHNATESLATRTPLETVATLTPTQTSTPRPTPTPEGPPVSLEDYERLFPGVFYKRQTSNSPRPYVAHIVVVDLNKRSIHLMVTPEKGLGQTASQFLESYGLQLAINGDGWLADSYDPIGFAASEGEVYSEDSQEPTIFISKNGIVKIGGNPPEKKIWYAISGSHTLVRNGQLDDKIRTCALQDVYCLDLAPRTSIGLSAGNYLIIVLVEGPPAEPRDALTLEELANLHLELGSVDALAMDGGGSSTLVIDNDGVPQILNSPSDGTERMVANHLGIFARSLNNDGD